MKISIIGILFLLLIVPVSAFYDSRECVDTTQLIISGDANHDGSIDISDPIYILSYLFYKGNAPPCLQQADVNNDGKIDISDAVFLFTYLFKKGQKPVTLNYDHSPFLVISPVIDDEIVINLANPVIAPLYPAFFLENDVTACYGTAYPRGAEDSQSVELFSFTPEAGVLDNFNSYEFILDKDVLAPGEYRVETVCYDKAGNEGKHITYLTIEDIITEIHPASPEYCTVRDVCCANENNRNGQAGNRYMCLKDCDFDPETGIDLNMYAPDCGSYLDQRVSPLVKGRWAATNVERCNKPSAWDDVKHQVIDYCYPAKIEQDGTISCGNICGEAKKELERRKLQILFSTKSNNQEFPYLSSLITPTPTPTPTPGPGKCKVKDATIISGRSSLLLGGEDFKFPEEFEKRLNDQPGLDSSFDLGTGPQVFTIPNRQEILPAFRETKVVGNAFLMVGVYVGLNNKGKEINEVNTEQCREFQFALASKKQKGVDKHLNVYPVLLDDVINRKTLKMLEDEGQLHTHKEMEIFAKEQTNYIENGECPNPDFKESKMICNDDYYYIKKGEREGEIIYVSKEYEFKSGFSLKKHNVNFGKYKGMFWYDRPKSTFPINEEASDPYFDRVSDYVSILEDEDSQNRVLCKFEGLRIYSNKNGEIVPEGGNSCKCSKWSWKGDKWEEDKDSIKDCAT